MKGAPVAGTSLLALIDDIATMLDDVAVMSKVAIKKTSGVLGDDLALNAEQVTGIQPDRELPVVWAVAKGSAINKLILVPTALMISFFVPWAITPLLMVGGLFLCYEGCEKISHKLFSSSPHEEKQNHQKMLEAMANKAVDLVQFEKEKIKGAVRTDFILSAEIIVISLGTVSNASFYKQLSVLTIISIVMTIGVYGLVAGIVKLDDFALFLCSKDLGDQTKTPKPLRHTIGVWLLGFAPWLLKFLSVAGMIAMFLVGGGIITHGIPPLEALSHQLDENFFGGLGSLFAGVVGLGAGAITLALIILIKKRLPTKSNSQGS
jgi:predicted DNA repair protein MutK